VETSVFLPWIFPCTWPSLSHSSWHFGPPFLSKAVHLKNPSCKPSNSRVIAVFFKRCKTLRWCMELFECAMLWQENILKWLQLYQCCTTQLFMQHYKSLWGDIDISMVMLISIPGSVDPADRAILSAATSSQAMMGDWPRSDHAHSCGGVIMRTHVVKESLEQVRKIAYSVFFVTYFEDNTKFQTIATRKITTCDDTVERLSETTGSATGSSTRAVIRS
jgi:hypothetical protein